MQDYQEIKTLKLAYIKKCKELETALSKYQELSEKMASTERDYLVAKSICILDLKDQGQSVTLIPAIVKGKVADERFEMRKAEGIFHACRENVKRLHANLDAYRSLLSVAKSEMDIR